MMARRPRLYFCLVSVARGYEFEYKYELQKQGLYAYVPLVTRITKPKNKKQPIETSKPLLPGYAFVLTNGDLDEVNKIRSAASFVELFTNDEEIIEVSIKEVLAFKKREAAGEFRGINLDNLRAAKVELFVNDMVRIVEGPLAGTIGIIKSTQRTKDGEIAIISSENKRLKISLELLARFGV